MSIGRAIRRLNPFSRAGNQEPIVPTFEWFDEAEERPRAILQVGPAVQANNVFVNYGGQVIFWAIKERLEENGFAVMRMPRLEVDRDKLKAQKAALFIDSPGFMYSDTHHKGMGSVEAARISRRNAEICRSAGALTVAAPQTFGPFSSDDENVLTREMRRYLTAMDLLYPRDPVSASHLEGVLPEAAPRIRTVPDSAFLYRSDHDLGREFLRGTGLDVSDGRDPIVGIVLSRQLYSRFPNYMESMVELVESLKSKECQLIAIPHETGRYGPDEKDDQYLTTRLGEQTGIKTASRKKERALPQEEELKYIHSIEGAIESLDFCVSGRFHAALRAIAGEVPTVVTSWSHKYPALFEDLELDSSKHILNGDEETDALDPELMIQNLKKAWNDRVSTRAKLKNSVPKIKTEAEGFINEIAGAALEPRA